MQNGINALHLVGNDLLELACQLEFLEQWAPNDRIYTQHVHVYVYRVHMMEKRVPTMERVFFLWERVFYMYTVYI